MTHVADVTIDPTTPDAAHADFPTYVNLADLPSAFWDTVKSDNTRWAHLFDGDSVMTAPTLGNVLAESSIRVVSQDVSIDADASTGYWFSQAGDTAGNREIGVWFSGDDLRLYIGGTSTILADQDDITAEYSGLVITGLLDLDVNLSTGAWTLVNDGGTWLTGTATVGVNRTDGVLFRLGARSDSNTSGATTSEYILPSGSLIGDTQVYLSGTLVRHYVSTGGTTSTWADVENSQDGTLRNANTDGTQWLCNAPAGGDIRCFLPDGTELAREVVSCVPASYQSFDGSDDYVSLASDVAIGSGDYEITIDFTYQSSSNYTWIFGNDVGWDSDLYIESNAYVRLRDSAGSQASWQVNSGHGANDFTFVAGLKKTLRFVRTSGTTELFIDDISYGTSTSAAGGFDVNLIGKGNSITTKAFDLYRLDLNGQSIYDAKDISGTTWTDSAGSSNGTLNGSMAAPVAVNTGELHVKFPLFSLISDNVIEIHADGVSSDYAVTDAFGRNAVFSDYSLVSHDGVTDSTGNNTATVTGTFSTTGILGDGLGADGAGDSVQWPPTTSIEDIFTGTGGTVSAWMRPDSTGGGTYGRLFQQFTGTSKTVGSWLNQTNELTLYHDFSNGGSAIWQMGINALGSDSHIAWTYDADLTSTQATGYLDGASQTLTQTGTPASGTGVSTSATSLYFANRFDGARSWDGMLDEFRVRKEILSADWIATEYANQNSPATFYTVSAVGGGDTYTLSLDAGSFALTGGTLNTIASRTMSLEAGSLSLTGGSVDLLAGRLMTLDAGTFTVSGGALESLRTRLMSLEAGSFSLSGGDVGFVYTPISGPTYTLALDAGSFNLSGGSVDVLAGRTLSLEAGSFSVSGGPVDFIRAYVLDLESGTFVVTGGDINPQLQRTITLEQGDFTVTGGVVNFSYSGAAKVVSIIGIDILQ